MEATTVEFIRAFMPHMVGRMGGAHAERGRPEGRPRIVDEPDIPSQTE